MDIVCDKDYVTHYCGQICDISLPEKESERMAYELYGLTKEEIAIVEGRE